ncbi:MAG: hypothetical protein M0Q95_09215 [Porticoccaceae bacterium]|jgi:hypothetical protein|nr:hypothetical protein [Porticoccaceae bacterium]
MTKTDFIACKAGSYRFGGAPVAASTRVNSGGASTEGSLGCAREIKPNAIYRN